MINFENVSKKIKTTSTGEIITFILLIIAMSIGGTIGREHVKQKSEPTNPDNYTWNTYSFDKLNSNLTIMLPGEPHQLDFNVPEALKSMVVQMENYDCDMGRLDVTTYRTLYKNGIIVNPQSSLEGALNGSISSMSNVEGVKNIQHKSMLKNISGRPGILATITYDFRGKATEDRCLYFIDNSTLSLVAVSFATADTKAVEAGQKVLDSIKLY